MLFHDLTINASSSMSIRPRPLRYYNKNDSIYSISLNKTHPSQQYRRPERGIEYFVRWSTRQALGPGSPDWGSGEHEKIRRCSRLRRTQRGSGYRPRWAAIRELEARRDGNGLTENGLTHTLVNMIGKFILHVWSEIGPGGRNRQEPGGVVVLSGAVLVPCKCILGGTRPGLVFLPLGNSLSPLCRSPSWLRSDVIRVSRSARLPTGRATGRMKYGSD